MTLDVTILLCAHARHPHSPNVLAEADQAPSAIAALFARSIGVHRRLRLESRTFQCRFHLRRGTLNATIANTPEARRELES
jgi:hypothetical protein